MNLDEWGQRTWQLRQVQGALPGAIPLENRTPQARALLGELLLLGRKRSPPVPGPACQAHTRQDASLLPPSGSAPGPSILPAKGRTWQDSRSQVKGRPAGPGTRAFPYQASVSSSAKWE